jgi:16S rRNA (cytidine1402-2'-O)-methyltransferase
VGRLIVVPTPIGNLEDITLRALRVLREVPLILAEDTRRTRTLLAKYEIETRVVSYHEHNARMRLPLVMEALVRGDVALVSDAGMPAVSDPGRELIQAAVERGIEVDVLPGPSAIVTALAASAIEAPGFLFLGFLPRNTRARRAVLTSVRTLPYALVLFEAPHRILLVLRDLLAQFGDRGAVAARELSKRHQEVVRSTLAELVEHFTQHEPRGEFTLVIAPGVPEMIDRSMDAIDALRRRREMGMPAAQAVADVADSLQLRRNAVYRQWLKLVGEEPEPPV